MRLQFPERGFKIIFKTETCLANRKIEISIWTKLIFIRWKFGGANYIKPTGINLISIVSHVHHDEAVDVHRFFLLGILCSQRSKRCHQNKSYQNKSLAIVEL